MLIIILQVYNFCWSSNYFAFGWVGLPPHFVFPEDFLLSSSTLLQFELWAIEFSVILKFLNLIILYVRLLLKILHPELSFSIHSLKCSYLIPHSRNLKKAHVLCATPRNDPQYSPYSGFIYSTICKRSRYCLWNIVRNFLHMFRII